MSQRRPQAGRTARPAGTSTAVTIVLVVVTALIGLLILNKLNNGSSASSASPGGTTGTEAPSTSTATTTPTTQPTVNMALAKILVANGAGKQGLAGQYSTAFKQAFPTATVLPATDANAKYTASAVYYATGFEGQAAQVAASIGLKPSGLFPPVAPLKDPSKLAAANVFVLLGTDKASTPVKVTPPTGAAGAAPPTTTATTVKATTTTTG
jgi:hypothetical protein